MYVYVLVCELKSYDGNKYLLAVSGFHESFKIRSTNNPNCSFK